MGSATSVRTAAGKLKATSADFRTRPVVPTEAAHCGIGSTLSSCGMRVAPPGKAGLRRGRRSWNTTRIGPHSPLPLMAGRLSILICRSTMRLVPAAVTGRFMLAGPDARSAPGFLVPVRRIRSFVALLATALSQAESRWSRLSRTSGNSGERTKDSSDSFASPPDRIAKTPTGGHMTVARNSGMQANRRHKRRELARTCFRLRVPVVAIARLQVMSAKSVVGAISPAIAILAITANPTRSACARRSATS